MSIQTLTDEQRAFVESIRDFAKRECGTREQRDTLTEGGAEPHSAELYERIAKLGWLGVSIPEQYGGSGGGAVDMCLLCEEFAHGLIPMGFFSVSMITAGAVERFGTEALKQEILGGVVAGRVEAIAMSEPEAGSDVGNLSCRAERVNGGYVINGQKTWITAAHKADHILLVCRTTRGENKHDGLSMISVPTDIDGLEIRGIDTMGGREVNDVFFTDAHVPAERLVGQQDKAWMQLMAGLNHERLIIAAQSLGMAQRAFDDVLAYVKERKQFGRPIGSFQALRHRLADVATELEATRLLIYDTAARVDANPGTLFPREASMCKLKATELAKHAALEGVQMMGGYGYAVEYDMERQLRAAVVTTIYGGTSEVQRDIISKTLGL
ncbi:MAG TPA: acyl-CoA dehydrogenase family protein [Solirubrobacteraceae bacterium]|jgi:alkylation response protein AidB-like acyl-CoA dehydrogenase|nr:acyl-CoA dehydrogenase family protein [Solirubrobacteraceae bacterium]